MVAVRNTLTAHQQAFAEFHGGLTGGAIFTAAIYSCSAVVAAAYQGAVA